MALTPFTDEFYDEQESGSLASARVVLLELWRHFQPAACIDVGCGVAPWLKAAMELGASLAVGIDGSYVRRDRLMVDQSAFRVCNIEKESCLSCLPAGIRFDLVICVETAEHLSKARAEVLRPRSLQS